MAKKTAKKVTKKVTKKEKVKTSENNSVENSNVLEVNALIKIAPSKNACHLLSIKQDDSLVLYSVSETGKEVSLSDNEKQFIESAFKNFKKAQEMLAQLYQS